MESPPAGHGQATSDELCLIPDAIYALVEQSLGRFFEPISRIDPATAARDMLDASKAIERFHKVSRTIDPRLGRVLEIGSGYGTNLIVWNRSFGVDITGVEPEGEGFGSTVVVSQELCRLNQVDPQRVVVGPGESLPFPDATFELVYSSYALEHTVDPVLVLREALRVLKPGGLLYFEVPNFLTPFEGHYLAISPPVVWRWLLPWYVKWVLRRDPAFARTLRTEINPFWIRRIIRQLSEEYPNQIVTLGEELFLERVRSLSFETKGMRSKFGGLLAVIRALNVKNWIGQAFVLTRTYYPIVLMVRRAS